MIQTLIVDDEPLNLDELKYLLSFHHDINITAEANNLNQALTLIKDTIFDLIFLDIQMDNEQAGFKIAQKISQLHNPPQIIFVTAYSQHSLKAYDYQPVHYILKPILEEKLDIALQRARTNIIHKTDPEIKPLQQKMLTAIESLSPAKKISIKYKCTDNENNTIYPNVYLYPSEILYINKNQLVNTCTVYCINQQFFEGVRITLQEFEQQFSDTNFFRVHQSFLVNLNKTHGLIPKISGKDKYTLLMKGSSNAIPVSPLKIKALRTALKLLIKN